MAYTCFNSTLVQLKVPLRWTWYASYLCFNSTLVQLKELVLQILNLSGIRFNSTLVQLKVLMQIAWLINTFCFNSTLVQLKAWITFARRQRSGKFQFYLSSIKSIAGYNITSYPNDVSILP